jgi:ribosomal protein S18 acetylase RimI-like enzyme
MPGGKVLRTFSYVNGEVRENLPLTIREAKRWEAGRVHALTQEAYALRAQADPPYRALSETVEDVRRQIEAGGAIVAVTADMEGEHVVGALRYREDAPGVLLGYRLAVSPKFQRRGIASRLLQRLDRVALYEGCDEIHLHVRRTSPELIALYEKFGYHLVDASKGPEYSHPIFQVVAKHIDNNARRLY